MIDCDLVDETLLQARKHILEIHTRDWNPKLAEPFVEELAEKCVGKSRLKFSREMVSTNYFCENIVFRCFKIYSIYDLTWFSCLGPRLLRC